MSPVLLFLFQMKFLPREKLANSVVVIVKVTVLTAIVILSVLFVFHQLEPMARFIICLNRNTNLFFWDNEKEGKREGDRDRELSLRTRERLVWHFESLCLPSEQEEWLKYLGSRGACIPKGFVERYFPGHVSSGYSGISSSSSNSKSDSAPSSAKRRVNPSPWKRVVCLLHRHWFPLSKFLLGQLTERENHSH